MDLLHKTSLDQLQAGLAHRSLRIGHGKAQVQALLSLVLQVMISKLECPFNMAPDIS